MTLGLLLGLGALPTVASAASGTNIGLQAEIDGRAVRGVGSNNAIKLGAKDQAALRLTVINRGARPVAIQRVRLEGTALGVTFLSYDAVVPVVVDPGERKALDVTLPIKDIRDQTVGLVPASIGVYNASGARVASQTFTLDVDGKVTSVFGALGLLIALFTITTMLLNLWLVLRRRLPPNRFFRGLRFAVPGAGIGLTICVTLAAFRVVAPYPSTWLPLVVVPTVGAFVLGFVSPGALAFDEDEIDVAMKDRELSTAGNPS